MFTQGTANADVLNGGAGDDTLYGAGGADRLIGNAGNDLMTGDAGNDTLSGGAGEDYLMGGAGNDSLDGGADADWASYEDATAAVKVDLNLTTAQNTLGGGTDTLKAIENLYGSAFNDTLLGNAASNYLYGGAGNDSLFGANGDDHFEGGAGNDTLNGGNGDDVVSYEDGLAGGVTIDLNLTTGQANGAHGTDTLISIEAIWGSTFDDNLTGNAVDNYLYGGAGADLIKGGAGADVLDGADGNDTIVGGVGADDLTGGAGDDLFQMAAGDSGVFTAAGAMTAGTNDAINDFQGGTRGTGAANGAGDTLDFGLTVGTATNYVENSAATSAAAATQANAAFVANSALRYVATQVGGDTLVFASDANGGEAHNLVALKGVGTASIGFNNIVGTAVIVPPSPPVGQTITGTPTADNLIGGEGNDTIQGLDGDDTITGGRGVDVLSGGVDNNWPIIGSDLYKFAEGDSTLAAPDQISNWSTGTRGVGSIGGTGDMLDFGLERGSSTNYVETNSSSAADALTQANTAFAANHNLRYFATNVAGTGDVQVFATDADGGEAHSLVTIKGSSTILLSYSSIVGQIPSTGELLQDTIYADTIVGGAGNDTIIGGQSNDLLTGGAGSDLFVERLSGSVTITDFNGAEDHIDLGRGPATAFNYIERMADPTDSVSSISNMFQADPLLRYMAVQNVGSVTVYTSDYQGSAIGGGVSLTGVSLTDIGFVNLVGENIGGPHREGGAGADVLVGLPATPLNQPGFEHENRDEYFSGGPGDDTIKPGSGDDTVSTGTGNDLIVYSPGDGIAGSGYTHSAIDIVLDFEGGTRGAGVVGGTGDKFDFGLGAGSATNYVETTSTDYFQATTTALSLFSANAALRYVVAQVDESSYLFANDRGDTKVTVALGGVTLDGISAQNIVDVIPRAPTPQLLVGSERDDVIVGGSLNDTLSGGAGGNDILFGGGGDDTFRFGPSAGPGFDHIYDFEGGTLATGVAGGTGDRLQIGLGAGTAANYQEFGYNLPFTPTPEAAFAGNAALRYLVFEDRPTENGFAQVNVYYSDADGGNVAGSFRLDGYYGLSGINQIGYLNFA